MAVLSSLVLGLARYAPSSLRLKFIMNYMYSAHDKSQTYLLRCVASNHTPSTTTLPDDNENDCQPDMYTKALYPTRLHHKQIHRHPMRMS